MSDLVAIAYDDLPTAPPVTSSLGGAVKGHHELRRAENRGRRIPPRNC